MRKSIPYESAKPMYLVDPVNPYESLDNTTFSSDMIQVLSNLAPEDLSLIMLKYQENYNDEDLASHFDLTINEIKQKEVEILSLLKNNDNVKSLKKKIN